MLAPTAVYSGKWFEQQGSYENLRGPSDAKRATNISIALCIWVLRLRISQSTRDAPLGMTVFV